MTRLDEVQLAGCSRKLWVHRGAPSASLLLLFFFPKLMKNKTGRPCCLDSRANVLSGYQSHKSSHREVLNRHLSTITVLEKGKK